MSRGVGGLVTSLAEGGGIVIHVCREWCLLEAKFEDVFRIEEAYVEGFPVVVSAMFVELSGFADVV